MQSKSETANRLRSDPHSFQPGGVYSEPWWRGIGYNPMAQTMSGANASNSSSLECPNGDSESNEEGQSLSNSGMEDDDATKDSQPAAPNQTGSLEYHVNYLRTMNKGNEQINILNYI